MNALTLWWTRLASREQRWISLGAVLTGLALLWLVAIAPAVRTLRASQAQHAVADSQLQTMQALAVQAKSLRAQRSLGNEEIQRNLESSVKQTLGTTGVLSLSEGRASLTLKGANADTLALWLNQARINARVVPSEVRLQRSAGASAPPVAAAASPPAGGVQPALWDGTMVLALPGR